MLHAAITEVARTIETDGLALRILDLDEKGRRAELELRFESVECDECVLPPDRIYAVVTSEIVRRCGPDVDVVLHDPRVVPPDVADEISTARIVVLDPTGEAPVEGGDPSSSDPAPPPAVGSLRGKVVAVRMDVLWRSWDRTVEEWTPLLEAAGATVRTWRRVQGLVGNPQRAAQAEYGSLLASADVVISGLANCGSCTSWSVRDGLAGETAGLPTVLVATAQFEDLARTIARTSGRPGLRLLVLPYPYDTLPVDVIRAHARAAFPDLLQTLGATV
jgi:hypothetical protein